VVASLLGTVVKISAVPIIAISHWYSSDISIIAISLGQVLTALLFWVYLEKRYPYVPSPSLARIFSFARHHHFLYTILGSASMILLVNLDVFIARQLFDSKSAGIYATWSLLSKVVFFTLGPLLTVSFVKQSKKVNLGENALDSSVNILILFCLASLIPLFIGYQYIAPIFLKFVFGGKFEALYQYLGLSGIFGAFTLLLNHLTNTHIARRSWMSIWTVMCVAIFASLSYILHPTLPQYYLLINATVIIASLGLYLGLHRT
jgi:O-antigen/teichoic acid export membrane protein